MLAALAAVMLALPTVAQATTSSRVIGIGRSAGDFAVAAASGQAKSAQIYLRGYGRGLSGLGVVACSRGIASIGSKSTTLSSMKSGQLYRLRMPFAGDCSVTASLSGAGAIRLQIIAA